MLNRIGVERVLPRSPMMVAQVLGHRLRADPAPPPGPSGTSVAVAAAHASLHRLVGPVASKLIERVRQDPASAQAGIAAYVERLASEIRIPSLRESFLQAMRGLHD